MVRRVERVHLVPGSNPGGAAAELVDLLAHRGFIAQFSAPLRLVQLLDRWTGSEALVFVGIAPAAGPGFAPRVELAHACRACFRGALRDGRRGLPGVVSRVRAGAGAGQAPGDGDVVRGAVRGEVRGCIAASVRGCDVRAALDEPSREVVVAGDAREVQRGATVGVHRLDIQPGASRSAGRTLERLLAAAEASPRRRAEELALVLRPSPPRALPAGG